MRNVPVLFGEATDHAAAGGCGESDVARLAGKFRTHQSATRTRSARPKIDYFELQVDWLAPGEMAWLGL
ncbi:hypothetical protein ON010_g19166 [Phytophthora cinnamomi]|nr:hypothetical protein ON010_g19166 [Phytophthora cinnamomi]